MWTYEETYFEYNGIVYCDVVMQETLGIFKAGEKIAALLLQDGETVGHYTMEEWAEDGGVLRTQEVKLVACE